MLKNNKNSFDVDPFESVINSDHILRYNLREAKMNYNNMDWQITVITSSFKIALGRYLDKKYN